ncbi:RNA dependent RNA polymerase-domain-containing protein [Umbelopsis sp. AD052]|nr:RNA dependent RNA polymerase-domain-containing protein [Umbelopsis sp. AD052]
MRRSWKWAACLHRAHWYRNGVRIKTLDFLSTLKIAICNCSFHITEKSIGWRNPPRYWKQNPKGQRMTKFNWSMSDQWERITTIPIAVSVPGTTSKRREPLMPIAQPYSVNLGHCVVYHLHITPAHRSVDQFKHLIEEAVNYNLFPRPSSMQFNIPITIRSSSELEKPIDHIGRATLHFDVLYILECAICSRVLSEYNLNEQFYDMLHKLDPDVSCRILETFISARKRVWNPIREFQDTWDKMGRQLLKPRKVPPQYALIRKFLVTPATMYPQVPNMETTNRVVRHFSQHVDRFARVQFLDDSLSRIGASPRGFSNEALYNRIFDVLQNGIQIGPRRYEFLAFSSSQLREHGCWFFAPTRDLRANHVRAWMGNFSNVRIVAKYSARMGQVKDGKHTGGGITRDCTISLTKIDFYSSAFPLHKPLFSFLTRRSKPFQMLFATDSPSRMV